MAITEDGKMSIRVAQDLPEINFATLDLLPYGIIVVDGEGKVLYYNAREEEIARRSKEDVIGKNFFTEIAPCTQVAEFAGRFRETMTEEGAVAHFNFHFPFADNPRDVEINLTSFENRGELLCLISVGDVTEQGEVRDQIMRAERLREVGEAAAGVAHNFNNLLTVICGNSELLLRKLDPEHPARKYADVILRASRDGAEMVKRIKEAVRQQPEAAGTTDVVDLTRILSESVALTEDYTRAARESRGAQIELRSEAAGESQPVRARANELREVFVNLLRNAVEAVKGEGEICVRSYARGRDFVAEITDTGEGMDAATLAKIFRPLFTTKGDGGTGLGLATCYSIVRRHGGDIRVESEPGRGTTFAVRLPAAD